MWPRAALHVFEPLAGPRATLAKVVGRVATIHPFALGAEDAEREIHGGSRADSSSLLPIGLNQTRIFGTTEAGSVTIKVRRLDGVFGRSEISAPALLKIDVQGFEYQVLEGIGALHEDIAWIFVEVSYIELYEGQRLAGEVDALLGRLGYRLGATHNLQRGADGQPIQADLLYVRDA
jgi:FkbM family methyltransferase